MLLHSIPNTVDDATAVVPARRSGAVLEVGGTMIDGLKGARVDDARVSPTDALMGGLISVLSGTLVVLWLQNARYLRMACGIVLCCYLACVVMMTMFTRHQRSAHLTRRD